MYRRGQAVIFHYHVVAVEVVVKVADEAMSAVLVIVGWRVVWLSVGVSTLALDAEQK